MNIPIFLLTEMTDTPTTTEQPKGRLSFAPSNHTPRQPTESIVKKDQQRRRWQLIATAICGIIIASVVYLTSTDNRDVTVKTTADTPKNEAPSSLQFQGLTYKGTTKDGHHFTLLAKAASETTHNPGHVILTAPKAKIDTESGDIMTISAAHGELFRDKNLFEMNGNVIINRPDIGYTLSMESATAHLNNGALTSNATVKGHSQQSTIKSSGIEINDQGRIILFKGKTQLTLKQIER